MLVYANWFSRLFLGGTFLAGRLAAGEIPPFTAAFLRFVFATFFLLIFLKRSTDRLPVPRGTDWFLLTLLGLTGVFAYNAFFFSGLKHVPRGARPSSSPAIPP